MSVAEFTLDAKNTGLMDSFSKDESVSDLVFVEGRDLNHKPLRLQFEVECLGDLLVSDYGHSVLCKLGRPEDVSTMEAIEDAAASVLDEKIDFKQFVKDEKFFLKLPFKNDKYKAHIDPPFVPSQPDKSPIHQGSVLDVHFGVSMWINFSSKTSGLFLNVSKITVDGGKKRTVKRR